MKNYAASRFHDYKFKPTSLPEISCTETSGSRADDVESKGYTFKRVASGTENMAPSSKSTNKMNTQKNGGITFDDDDDEDLLEAFSEIDKLNTATVVDSANNNAPFKPSSDRGLFKPTNGIAPFKPTNDGAPFKPAHGSAPISEEFEPSTQGGKRKLPNWISRDGKDIMKKKMKTNSLFSK